MERKRARIYCRVAHSDAHALTVQQASLEAYAEMHGFELVGTSKFLDGEPPKPCVN